MTTVWVKNWLCRNGLAQSDVIKIIVSGALVPTALLTPHLFVAMWRGRLNLYIEAPDGRF